ncbi:MAG TPA: type II toxin-antitoxin system VapC family toxin [Candidatus Limnocylindria bacterium]|nr:type II toxin-antitoxin system VapC family toxin [Candidatus Limnocylindria bacterium]
MKLLLDTCALLWLAENSASLSTAARQAIVSNPDELFVSAISAFEIGLKHRRGRLNLGLDPETWWQIATAHHGLAVVPISDEIALASTALPLLHADPCDRIIIATASCIGARMLTSDSLIMQYPNSDVIW